MLGNKTFEVCEVHGTHLRRGMFTCSSSDGEELDKSPASPCILSSSRSNSVSITASLSESSEASPPPPSPAEEPLSLLSSSLTPLLAIQATSRTFASTSAVTRADGIRGCCGC